MDHYHEDLICVLKEVQLHHYEQAEHYNSIYHSELRNYHCERANFIQSELDRLAEKYR